jgi:transposase-like protein
MKIAVHNADDTRKDTATKIEKKGDLPLRTRELGQYNYILLDARYEKVRYAGKVIDHAILIATGVNAEGMRWTPKF